MITQADLDMVMPGNPAGTGSGVQGGFFGNLLDTITGSDLIQTGLSAAALQDQMSRLSDIGSGLAAGAKEIGQEAQAASAFRPFTVSTGFGGVTTTPEGGFTTALSPAMAAQQQQLQGITSGLLGGMGAPQAPALAPGDSFKYGQYLPPSAFYQGNQRALGQQPLPVMGDVQISPIEMQRTDPRLMGGMDFMEFTALPVEDRLRIRQEGLDAIAAEKPPQPAQLPQAPTVPATGGFGAGIPDVSGITRQALGGVGGFLTGATAPMAQREADVYERIRATQRPEEQRQQLALEERLAAQGRTGLRTAQFGGSPEQFALAQAQEEAKNRAALAALGQAQAEQQQQLGLAQGLFGLGSGAAALPASLQQAQLGNIGAALGLQYLPEQQLLGALSPAINLANIAGTGQRQGAGYLAQAGTTGLEALGQTEIARANLLRDLYSGLLAQQTSAETGERQESIAGGLFGDLISGIGSIFGGQ